MEKPNCLFCNLYEKWRDSGKIIFENESAYSIFNVTSAVPGHAVVIPRKHVLDLTELSNGDLSNYIQAIPQTFNALRISLESNPEYLATFYQALRDNPPTPSSREFAELMLKHQTLRLIPEGYNTGMNIGKPAGQLVDHTHTHIFPRFSGQKTEGIVTAMRNFLS